jgi:hypothetical protein
MVSSSFDLVVFEFRESPEYNGLVGFLALLKRKCRQTIVRKNLRYARILFRRLKRQIMKRMENLSDGEKMELYRQLRSQLPAFKESLVAFS